MAQPHLANGSPDMRLALRRLWKLSFQPVVFPVMTMLDLVREQKHESGRVVAPEDIAKARVRAMLPATALANLSGITFLGIVFYNCVIRPDTKVVCAGSSGDPQAIYLALLLTMDMESIGVTSSQVDLVTYLVLVVTWLLFAYGTVSTRMRKRRALWNLENVALFLFMPLEYLSFLFRTDLANHRDFDAIVHDLFTFFYMVNIALFIAVTTTFEIVPLQEGRHATILYNATLVMHVAITMVTFVAFGDCGQEVLLRAEARLGHFLAGYVYGLAHFSITHRFLMLVALVFKQHLQIHDEELPTIMHIWQAIRLWKRSRLVVLTFLLVAFGTPALFTTLDSIWAAYSHHARLPPGWPFMHAFAGVLSVLTIAQSMWVYSRQAVGRSQLSWEGRLIFMSAAVASIRFYTELKAWQDYDTNKQLYEVIESINFMGFMSQAVLACDTFSHRIQLSARASLLPFFVAFVAILTNLTEEVEAVGRQKHGGKHGVGGHEVAAGELSHLAKHVTEIAAVECALLQAIGWLAHCVEELALGSGDIARNPRLTLEQEQAAAFSMHQSFEHAAVHGRERDDLSEWGNRRSFAKQVRASGMYGTSALMRASILGSMEDHAEFEADNGDAPSIEFDCRASGGPRDTTRWPEHWGDDRTVGDHALGGSVELAERHTHQGGPDAVGRSYAESVDLAAAVAAAAAAESFAERATEPEGISSQEADLRSCFK